MHINKTKQQMILENKIFIENSIMIIPIVSYLNADTDKDKIITDN